MSCREAELPDYVVWRKTDSDNPQGYMDFVENFGEGMGPGGGAAAAMPSHAAVPEPAAVLLLLGLLPALHWVRRR